jgi:myo-inositol 2-dehydrogenase/D-chiro-inositol 1-dehydrogenase
VTGAAPGDGDALRVGILGAGYIGSRHAASLSSIAGVRVTAVADPRPDRVETVAAATGARAFPDHQRMLDAGELDALYICVPPYAHGAPELAAVERRLPFFVEKPIALDEATADAVAAEVARRGLVTGTGYHWRYLDTMERARELLAADPCRLLIGYWLDRVPGTDWWVHEARSGGQLVEQVTHLFDLARYMVGEIVSVQAEGARFPRRSDLRAGDIMDVTTATLRFGSGAVGSLSSSCLLRAGSRIGLELVCEGLLVQMSEQELIVDDGARREVRRVAVDPYLAEDRDFVAAVRGRVPAVRAPYEEAVRTHRVAVAASRAAREGRGVRLELGPAKPPTAG